MRDVIEVMQKVAEARRQRRDSLKGVERMQYNLSLRLRGWMIRKDSVGYVTVGQTVEKVMKYAPKAIRRSRAEAVRAIENLWAVTHDYSIWEEDWLREDLEMELSYYEF